MRDLGRLLDEKRLFYSAEDVAERLRLPLPSALTLLKRKVASGEILRIRRNLYVLPQAFTRFGTPEFFRLANIIQTPSYVSYISALAYHEMTTQIPVYLVESANPLRAKVYQAKGWTFRYYFCRPELYFGFSKSEGIFIAEPEKALLDALYLLSLGRYSLDSSALDLKEMAWKKLEASLKKYPPRFRRFFKSWRDAHERAGTP